MFPIALSIILPLILAALSAFLTYKFTINSKRVEILYQNKIPAFKEIAYKIIEFKNFCDGRVAYFRANEYSPFYEEGAGTLKHRTEIAKSFPTNNIFLSRKSKILVTDLINNMSGLCSAEVSLTYSDIELDPSWEYERMSILSSTVIENLYQELNLT